MFLQIYGQCFHFLPLKALEKRWFSGSFQGLSNGNIRFKGSLGLKG